MSCKALEQQIEISEFGIQETQFRPTFLRHNAEEHVIYISSQSSSSSLAMYYLSQPLATYLGVPHLRDSIHLILNTPTDDIEDVVLSLDLPSLPASWTLRRSSNIDKSLFHHIQPVVDTSSQRALVKHDIFEHGLSNKIHDYSRNESRTPENFLSLSSPQGILTTFNSEIRIARLISKEEVAEIMEISRRASLEIGVERASDFQNVVSARPRSKRAKGKAKGRKMPYSTISSSNFNFIESQNTNFGNRATRIAEPFANEESIAEVGFAGEYFVIPCSYKLNP